ncbi:MAG: hypothetical protein ABSD20_12865 [Terriglobales bacterium]
MTNELQDPAESEHAGGIWPNAMNKYAYQQAGYRNYNQGNADRVAHPVDRMLMAAGILRDPLLAAASA